MSVFSLIGRKFAFPTNVQRTFSRTNSVFGRRTYAAASEGGSESGGGGGGGGEFGKRNKNVNQEEQQATAENIFNHYGLLGPLPLFDANEAHGFVQSLNMAKKMDGVDQRHFHFKAHLLFPFIYDIVTNRMLVTSVQSVLGPNVLITNSAVHTKSPLKSNTEDNSTPWNQISADWWDESTHQNNEVAIVHLALTNSTIENGGFKIVPASHQAREDFVPVNDEGLSGGPTFIRSKLADQENQEKKAVAMPLDAGEAILFHPGLVHSSTQNCSNRTHEILSICYAATSSKPFEDERWGKSALAVGGKDEFRHYEMSQRRPKAEMDAECLGLHTRELLKPL